MSSLENFFHELPASFCDINKKLLDKRKIVLRMIGVEIGLTAILRKQKK